MHRRTTIGLTVGTWLGLSVAVPLLGQSSYHFSNLVPGYGVDAPVFDAEGNRLAGSNYVALLYGGSSPDDLRPALRTAVGGPLEPTPFLTGALSGYFFGGTAYVDSGVGCGGYAWLQVRAWDRRLGATYEEVEALGLGGYGFSEVFQTRGGNPCLGGVPTPPEPLIGLRSFSLVPEPSVWALAALGGLVLGWSRWRRLRNRDAAR